MRAYCTRYNNTRRLCERVWGQRKWSEKLTRTDGTAIVCARAGGRAYPYRALCTGGGGQQSFCILLSIFRSNKHHQMVSLRLRAAALMRKHAHTHTRTVDRLTLSGTKWTGRKKTRLQQRQQNKREHLVNKKTRYDL